MQVKIVTKKETVEYIEVEFPSYKKYGTSFYKLTEDKKLIEVNNDEYDGEDFGIRMGNICYWDMVLNGGEDITEVEFERKFSKVFSKITTTHKPIKTLVEKTNS